MRAIPKISADIHQSFVREETGGASSPFALKFSHKPLPMPVFESDVSEACPPDPSTVPETREENRGRRHLQTLASTLLQRFDFDTVLSVFRALQGLQPITHDSLGAFHDDEPPEDEIEPEFEASTPNGADLDHQPSSTGERSRPAGSAPASSAGSGPA
jgi:hypothetical protein